MSDSIASLLGHQCAQARPNSVVRLQQWLKKRLRDFHESRAAHVIIITLVFLDTVLVLAELYIDLFSCEQPDVYGFLRGAVPVIGNMSLAISTTFMIELISSLYAFGWLYFVGRGCWLRLMDAVVIIASFVVDILTQGTLSEGAELIVVLRFWRIAKIAEEVGTEATQEMEELKEDNRALRLRVMELERRLDIRSSDDSLNDQARPLHTPQDA
ncbi:hypothetical protein V1506DRAFT_553012 [Lipomyces tetrasporus]